MKDIAKTKISDVEKKVDKIIRKLDIKKSIIIADIKLKEKSLLEKVSDNPIIWNSKSFQVNLELSKSLDLSSAIKADVMLAQVEFQVESFCINIRHSINHILVFVAKT